MGDSLPGVDSTPSILLVLSLLEVLRFGLWTIILALLLILGVHRIFKYFMLGYVLSL
jgi:hypothetical protein